MPEPLDDALAELAPLLLDVDRLVRAVAAGRRRGEQPRYRRAELRPVELKAGRRLQVVTTDGLQPVTTNHPPGPSARAVVAELLAEPFGNWHVQTTDQLLQLRVTKKGQAQVHRGPGPVGQPSPPAVAVHDRVKRHLLAADDPLFDVLGADADKRRQVDAFLRQLAVAAPRAVASAAGRDLHVVDLGCGNAYLTFAAHRYLAGRLGGRVVTVGVDRRADMVARNRELAGRLELAGLRFVTGTIEDADPQLDGVDVVLALHACDTATDDALARAVRWAAPVVLAAPCCHHDVQRQLDRRRVEGVAPPHPYGAITRHAILRERLADVLTDALRADVLRVHGYRVDVVEFVDSRHTPRNALLRAERTGTPATAARRAELADLAGAWGVRPCLAQLLGEPA